MELGKSDKSKDRRPKGDYVDYSPSTDDEGWEKVKNQVMVLFSLGVFCSITWQ